MWESAIWRYLAGCEHPRRHVARRAWPRQLALGRREGDPCWARSPRRRRPAGRQTEPAARRRRRPAAGRGAAVRLARRDQARERARRARIDVAGLDCLDVGASTGGFTDCLLQRGAARVIALDVAHGQLDWGLRNDERVSVIERLNARELRSSDLPFAPALATIDVSFISAGQGAAGGRRRAWSRGASHPGDGQAAVRARARAGRAGGVVRDRRRPPRGDPRASPRPPSELGLAVRGFASSGLPGPKGNRETFLWLGDGESSPDLGDRRSRASLIRRPASGGPPMSPGRSTARHDPQRRRPHPHAARADRGRAARAVAAARRAGCVLGADRPSSRSTARAAEGIERARRARRAPDLCLVLGGDGTILHALRALGRHRSPRLRDQLRHRRLPRRGRARGLRRRASSAPSRGEFEVIVAARRSQIGEGAGVGAQRRLPDPPAARTASPSWPTGSAARRSATSAATASSPRPRPARPATTSPTRGRSSPGA